MAAGTPAPLPGGVQRILIQGVTGSGKSTLAAMLAGTLGLPCHLADEEVGWLPGWTNRPVAQQRELAAALVAQPGWALDGAYSPWWDLVVPRAQVVVCLDYPRLTSLRRLLVRSIRRAATREPVCNGNTESIRILFSGESIIAWHSHSFARKRAAMRALAAAPGAAHVVLLRSPRHTRAWLSGLARSCAPERT
ncbi:adenylate kinase [Pseudarthrobacter sp. P1]|uniref:adenylate kinase n=1 Tax=Pseudarthrobacter sp. P1 TaxID=3418418 RepID=UPI003CE83A38